MWCFMVEGIFYIYSGTEIREASSIAVYRGTEKVMNEKEYKKA